MNIFNPHKVIEDTIAKLKEEIKLKNTLVAVSGGVDSATTAIILTKADIQIRCIFIDTGFMRKNESKEALSLLKKNGINAELLSA
jgi:GMP synthase (glutamine-hydrolysing)